MSNNQVSSSSTYTALFTTGVASVTDLIVSLPTGDTVPATPTVTVSTASSCTGTFSSAAIGTVATNLSGSANNIGIPLSSAIATLGTCVKVVIQGITNQASVGTAYACVADGTGLAANVTSANLASMTCGSGGLGGTINALLGVVDNAAVALTFVAQATNGVTDNLSVAPVLTVNVDSTSNSFSITPTASGVVASSATNNVTVATNAQTYTLQAVIGGSSAVLTLSGNNSYTIPLTFQQATGLSGTNPTAAACPSNGTGTSFGSNGTYNNVASTVTGLTNGTVTNVNYCWKVDLTKPSGTYTASLTYLAVPSF